MLSLDRIEVIILAIVAVLAISFAGGSAHFYRQSSKYRHLYKEKMEKLQEIQALQDSLLRDNREMYRTLQTNRKRYDSVVSLSRDSLHKLDQHLLSFPKMDDSIYKKYYEDL